MISGVKRHALSLGLTFAIGLAITPVGCGGSRRASAADGPPRGDAEVPEKIALQIRTCAAKRLDHLQPPDRTVSFDVKLTSDGEVDSVALRDSTLDDEPLEACMAHALRALNIDDLSMRRSESHPRRPAPSESRALFGQAEEALAGCLTSPPCLLTLGFLIAATYIVVQIYVHAGSQTSVTKQQCIDMYVECTEKTHRVRCDDCLHYCRAQGEWPESRCPR